MAEESSRVYIGDLGTNGSKQEIEEAFKNFGSLKSVWVARNPPGFAFVEFEDARDAEDCVKELNGKKVCGVNIRVELAKNSSRTSGGRGYRGDSDQYDRRKSPRQYGSRSPDYRRPRYPDRDYNDSRRREYGRRSPSPPPYYYRRSRSPPRY